MSSASDNGSILYRFDDKHFIRQADEHEIYDLSCILMNAFLPLWNHNWFQKIRAPLQPYPIVSKTSSQVYRAPSLLEERRRRFYECLLRLNVLQGGKIYTLMVERTDDGNHMSAPAYGAILLWLPPYKHATTLPALFKSGFLKLAIRDYGLMSFYRVLSVFEGNIEKMHKQAGIDSASCGFVQMLASNDAYRGKGYASQLLAWQIDQYQQAHSKEVLGCGDRLSSGNVVLDTTTDQGIRAYERLGFDLIGQRRVKTSTDSSGVNLRNQDCDFVNRREQAKRVCVQSVMIKRFKA